MFQLQVPEKPEAVTIYFLGDAKCPAADPFRSVFENGWVVRRFIFKTRQTSLRLPRLRHQKENASGPNPRGSKDSLHATSFLFQDSPCNRMSTPQLFARLKGILRLQGPHARRWAYPALLAALLLVHAWWATAGRWSFASDTDDLKLLNAQVEAFAAGQLSLLEPPDPRLLALQNPYSPEQNRATRLLDAVLFEHKYYTYFGPAPLVLLMLPWKVVFSTPIPPALLAWLLGLGAALAQALAVRTAARRWFPSSSPLLRGALAFGYGSSGLLFCLEISHETFDIPVLAGLCFTGWQIYFSTRLFAGAARRVVPELLLASVCAGLAAASRASLIPPAALLLFGLTLFLLHAQRTAAAAGSGMSPGRSQIRNLLIGAATPFAACLVALFIYNAARFGSPFDFGNKYTLVEVDWTARAAFSPHYLPLNAYYNFLSVPKLTDHFPFFADSAAPPFSPSAGYLASYVDRMMGCLPAYSFFLFAIAALPLACSRAAPKGLHWLLGTFSGAGVLLSLVLCAFVGASVRYQAELLAPFYLPAAMAALWLSTRGNRLVASVAHVLTLGLLAWTFATNFIIASVGYRGLLARNAAAAQSVARLADGVVYPIQRALGNVPRMPLLTIRFPTDKTGKLEPLWVGGRPGDADFLYINYVSADLIQFAFESMGRGGPSSAAVPIDYHAQHQLRLLLGPYAPSASHPMFRGTHPDPARAPDRMLAIELDGKIVLNAAVLFHDPKGVFFWGSSPDEAAFGRRFTGELELNWEPFTPKEYQAWKSATAR